MPQFDSNIAFWILMGSCLIGLLAVVAVRKSEGSRSHTACTWIFYLSMLAVGLTVILFLGSPSGMGLYAGITLGVMMIGTTCDFRPRTTPLAS